MIQIIALYVASVYVLSIVYVWSKTKVDRNCSLLQIFLGYFFLFIISPVLLIKAVLRHFGEI